MIPARRLPPILTRLGRLACPTNPVVRPQAVLRAKHSQGMSTNHRPVSAVQKLYQYARQHVRRDLPLKPKTIQDLCKLSGAVPLEELGFHPDAIMDPAGYLEELKATRPHHPLARDCITYLHIYEDSHMTIGIFCLPPNVSLPLHDHPGMTVVSRLLFGSMHVRAFDWLDPSQYKSVPTMGERRPAQLVLDATITAPVQPLVLYPTGGGNMHEFTAITPCAFLDILTPPYEPAKGRDCTYFQMHPPPQPLELVRSGAVLDLEVYDPPAEFEVVRGPYDGIPVES